MKPEMFEMFRPVGINFGLLKRIVASVHKCKTFLNIFTLLWLTIFVEVAQRLWNVYCNL
jgi:hypothetical protein